MRMDPERRNSRHVCMALLACLLLLPAAPTAPALPAATIDFPKAGSVLYERVVNVSGNASGSDSWWNHTAVADFNGSCTGTTVKGTKGGEILLSALLDDFNDNSIDSSIWSTSASSGFSVAETGSELKISGTAASQYWVASGTIRSLATGIDQFSASMKISSTSAGGYCSVIQLYEDSNDYFQFGIIYDSYGGIYSQCWYWLRSQGGATSYDTLDSAGSGWHNLMLTYNSSISRVYMYVDSVLEDSQSLTISNWKIGMNAFVRGVGDSMDARFDNVAAGTAGAGNYTSPILDSHMQNPELRKVNWTASEPAGTGASVFLRSSPYGDMSSASGWAKLLNGQSDFQSIHPRRFLQYRVEMHTQSLLDTPVFESICIRLYKDVVRVEVSTTQSNWRTANGTTRWSAQMDLLEGERTIYCRVTDASGGTATTSVKVRVDTIKAVGALEIDNGAEIATQSKVVLGITYTGPVPVTSLQLSNRPDFSGASWANFAQSLPWDLSDGDGIKTVFARLRDTYGLVSDAFNATIRLDTTPPVGRVEILADAPVVATPFVNLSLNATDDSGVEAMQLSGSAVLDYVEWIPFEPRVRWDLGPGCGLKTVYARFRDAAGLVSAVMSASILLVAGGGPAPAALLRVNDGASCCRERNITINIMIMNGSAAWMLLGNDPGLAGAAWRPFESSVPWALTAGDGPKTIYANFATSGGILFVGRAEVALDTVAPVGSILINDGTAECAAPSVKLSIAAKDTNGITAMRVSNEPALDDRGWEPFADRKDWNLTPGDGTKKVYLRLRDPAGWVSAEISASIFLRSRPAPTGNVSINKAKAFTRSTIVNLTLWLDDPTLAHGASMMLSNFENFSGASREPFSFSKNWILLPGDGLKTVYVMFESDRLLSSPAKDDIVLDATSPTGPIFDAFPDRTRNTTLRLSGRVEPGARLSFNAQYITVRSDGRFMTELPLALGRNIVQVWVADEAGNTNITNLEVVRLPKAPVTTPGPDIGWLVVLACVAIALVVVGAYLVARPKMAALTPVEGSDGPGDGAPTLPPEAEVSPRAAPKTPGDAPGRLVLQDAVNIEDLDEEETGPQPRLPSEPPGPATAPRQGAERFGQTQILRALTSLPRGLPSTLWGYDMDELAAEVASGQHRTTADGDLLVKVGTHWYHGDPADVGMFMQLYRGG